MIRHITTLPLSCSNVCMYVCINTVVMCLGDSVIVRFRTDSSVTEGGFTLQISEGIFPPSSTITSMNKLLIRAIPLSHTHILFIS